MPKFKSVPHTDEIMTAIDYFYDTVEELGSEVNEAYENMPESLKSGDRGTTLEHTAGLLENIQQDIFGQGISEEIEQRLKQLPAVTYYTLSLPGKKAGLESRATRMSNGVSAGRAVIDEVQKWIDEERKLLATPLDMSEEPSEGAVKLVETMRAEHSSHLDDIEDWCHDFEEHVVIADSCEFPGMFG